MAYYEYIHKRNDRGNINLEFYDYATLAGCKNGVICQYLNKMLKPGDNPNLGWVIPIGDLYRNWDDGQSYSFIIDLKPNSTTECVMYELDMIFGFSYKEWSPIMLRTKELYNDYIEDGLDKNKLDYPSNPEVVYTMLYLAGSFENGSLKGTWNFPNRSSTNSVMLFSEAMSFFFQQIKKYDPDMLEVSTNTIQQMHFRRL